MALQTKDFSATGPLTTGQDRYTYTLRVTEVAVDIATNTSLISVQAILRKITTGSGFSNRSVDFSCVIGGETIFSSTKYLTLTDNQEHSLHTAELHLPHDADGKLTVQVTGRIRMDNASLTLPAEKMTLTPIARASTIHAVDTPIGGRCPVGILSAGGGMQHTVQYRFGALSGYLTQDGGISPSAVYLPAGTIYWQLQESFYHQILDKRSDSCQLICTTYYNGGQVGEPSVTSFRAYADEAICRPILNSRIAVVDEKTLALTGGDALIRYYSTVRCTPNAQPMHYATIAQTQVNGQTVTGEYLDISEADTGTFLFRACDSRGLEQSQQRTLAMIPYEKTVLKVEAQRVQPGSTDVIVRVEGRCCRCNFGAQENTMTLRYELGGRNPVFVPVELAGDGSFSVTFQLENVDYAKASRLAVFAEDLVDTAVVRIWVQAGEPVFHWDKEQFTFCVPVNLKSSVSGLYIRKGSKLQSRFSEWGEAGQYQPVWMFGLVNGQPAQGILVIGSDGSRTWTGSPQLSFTDGKKGKVKLPATLTCLSPEPMDMEE